MSLHVWQDTTKTDWVIAEDEADAASVWADHYEGDSLDVKFIRFVQLPDDAPLQITVEATYDRDSHFESKTCSQWVEECGRGFLASTEY